MKNIIHTTTLSQGLFTWSPKRFRLFMTKIINKTIIASIKPLAYWAKIIIDVGVEPNPENETTINIIRSQIARNLLDFKLVPHPRAPDIAYAPAKATVITEVAPAPKIPIA